MSVYTDKMLMHRGGEEIDKNVNRISHEQIE